VRRGVFDFTQARLRGGTKPSDHRDLRTIRAMLM